MKIHAYAAAALLSLGLASCGPYSPRRPQGLPAEAQWAGDKAQGAFFLIGPQVPGGWQLRVYDRKGQPLAEGVFLLRGAARSELKHEDLAGFAGGIVHLKDGGFMTPAPRP